MRILITGASGLLGQSLYKHFSTHNTLLGLWHNRPDPNIVGMFIDLTNQKEINKAFKEFQPDVCLHAGAVSNPDFCEQNPNFAYQINQKASEYIRDACIIRNTRVVFYSTDYVFDGNKSFYTESDKTCPLQVYGKTKLAAENVFRSVSNSLICRLSLLYGDQHNDRNSFLYDVIEKLVQKRHIYLCDQQIRYPLFCPDVAKITQALIDKRCNGIFHFSGPNSITKYEWGKLIEEKLLGHIGLIHPNPVFESIIKPPRRRALRPKNVCLNTEKLLSFYRTKLKTIDEGSTHIVADFKKTMKE